MDTMKDVDYLHQPTSGRLPEEKPETKRLGAQQQQDADLNRSSVSPEDVQQLLVIKEVPQDWSPGQDLQAPDFLYIKQEQEEPLSSEEGQQLNGLEEADLNRLPFTIVTVKTEDDEEKPQCSYRHQSQTEDFTQTATLTNCLPKKIKTEIEEDCRGLESAWNPDLNCHLLLNNKKALDSSETEVSYEDDEEEEVWQEPLSDSGPETEMGGIAWKESRVPESEFVGDVCVKTFTQQDNQKRQTRGEKSLACGVCGKTFSCNTHLKRHMTVHTGEKPFSCEACGKRFGLEFTLKTHMRVHTGEKPFGCEDCGKTFSRNTHLKNHMRVHTQEKPFSCDACGKTFKFKYSFKVHMRVHTGERPFGCSVCGKGFTEHEGLKRHMRIHTGEKPFGCDICGKRFGHQNALKRHTSVHTGEKPFGCDICGKRFNRSTRFKEHLRGHTGEKLFGCDECGKTFSSNTRLKRHTSIHRRDKQFLCGVCGEKCSTSEQMKQHESSHMLLQVETIKL